MPTTDRLPPLPARTLADGNPVVVAARAFVAAADALAAQDMQLSRAQATLDAFDATFQALCEAIASPERAGAR